MRNETTRLNMKEVDISLTSKVYLCRLFGHSMLYVHGKQREKTWRKILRRIVTALKKSINKNVSSDGFHKERLDLYIEQLEDACKLKENIDPEIIIALTNIIFELLGGTPDYSHRSRLNKKTDYTLNDLRTLTYIQKPWQKVCTILEASRYPPYSNSHSYRELFEEYTFKFNGKPSEFLDWYKEKYPAVYMKIF